MQFVVDPWNYRVYLSLRGLEPYWEFEVEHPAWELVQSMLVGEKVDNELSLFVLECRNDQRVAVAMDDIEAANYYFDTTILKPRPPHEGHRRGR